MPDDATEQEKNKAIFMSLVVMFATTGMQQLGKIVNPTLGKAQVDLQSAEATIDLLTMLDAKTRGNLDDDERKALSNALSALRLNYVETAQMETQAGADAPPAAEPAGEQKPPDKGADQTQGTKEQPKGQPSKYHKSYG